MSSIFDSWNEAITPYEGYEEAVTRKAAENVLNRLPHTETLGQAYVELLVSRGAATYSIGPWQNLRMWTPSWSFEAYDIYLFAKYLPDCFPFADDEGSGVLISYFGSKHPAGIYRTSFGALSETHLVFVADNLITLFTSPLALQPLLED